MSVPRILHADEWEALASVQQDALILASHEDRVPRSEPVVAAQPDPSIASERDYQEKRAAAARGGIDYVRWKEHQIAEQTRTEQTIR